MSNLTYSDAYKMQCRAAWYANGSPSPKKCMELKIMPADEQGRVVEHGTLKHWFTMEYWYEWKDEQDARLSMKIDDELLAHRMGVVKEQLAQVRVVRNTAYDEIVTKGFDTSASAVKGFFSSMEEERGLMQIEKVIKDLSEKETSDLQREFRELAERSDGVVDGDVEDE